MRIVHLVWSMGVGGIESMLLDELAAMASRHELHLLVVDAGENPLLRELPQGVVVHRTGRPPRCSKLRSALAACQIAWRLRRIAPDVAVCHHYGLGPAIRFYPGPKVCRIHDIGLDATQRGQFFDQWIAVSDSVARTALLPPGSPAPAVIPNGIRTAGFAKRATWSIQSPMRIGVASRLDHLHKGQDVLLRALATVRQLHGFDEWSVDLIGDGPSRAFLEELAKQLGLRQHVRFLGTRDRAFLCNSLCTYDVICQPSRYEGFGNSALEAMAAKVPLVASATGGLIESTQNGRFATLFQPNDCRDCARALLDIHQEYVAARIGARVEKAYQHVVEHHDITVMADQLQAVYDSVAGRPQKIGRRAA